MLVFPAAMALAQAGDPLDPLRFLLGTWTADSSNELGTSHGATTFKFDLAKHVIVRTNFAEYSKGRLAGTRHDDLMIIYAEGEKTRAIYFDSEGHTIRYKVTIPSANTVLFESEPGEPAPHYRQTNSVHDGLLDGKFEIAERGDSQYKTYLTWQAARQP